MQGPLYYDKAQDWISNQNGFRGPDFKLKKPKETFRVLTIGGSAVGGGLSEELRKNFQADCPEQKCELIDGGVAGSVSVHELYNLTRWMAYRPDLIIVYDGWNDVYYSHYTSDRYQEQYQMTSRLIRKWHKPSHALIRSSYFIEGAIGARSKLRKFFEKPLYAAEPLDETLKISWMGGMTVTNLNGNTPQDHFSKIYQQNLTAMADTAEKANVPIVFILQPSLTTVGLKQGFNETGKQIINQLKPKAQDDWMKASDFFFPLAQKAQRQARQYHGKPFYDFNTDPGIRQEYFHDLVHLTQEGNIWAAGRIFEIYKKEKIVSL